jgi:hypothetical protein
MEAMVDEALRRLHEFVGAEEFVAEIQRAQEEFYRRIGAPLPGEPLQEARLTSFTEWFIFDRRLEAVGRTPVEEYLRRYADEIAGAGLDIFLGFTRTVHSLFRLQRREDNLCDLVDLYTLEKYLGVKRVPPTLNRDDIAELRLAPAGESWFATDAFCFHPIAAHKTIGRLLKTARKKNEPMPPLLERLMAMNTQYQRYPKTAKDKAYLREPAQILGAK